ncbi:MAG TPA: DUF481 domain-containing protein, partial [Candidatus Angelobacter sp.]|nr:DUF481 domain-containing protein [Candidatus Angelobacter sp.]
MKIKLTVVLAVLVLLCPSLFADQITLKNGDRLTGTIEKSDAKTLVIKTESAGEVTVQWAAIDSITSTQPLHVGLNGGQMAVGPVTTTSDGKIEISTAATGVVTTSKDSIVVIRSDSEEAAYDATMERLQHPHLSDYWSGALDTGLSLTRGNSATLSYTLSGKAIRKTDRDKITAYTTIVYGRNDNTSPSQTIAHQIQGGVRGDIDISARMFAFASTDFNSNQLQHLDLQNVIAGGIGYHLIKTKNTTFDVFGGAGYNQEYFSSYSLVNPAPPPPLLTFAAVTQRNAEIELGEEFDTKVSDRTNFGENFTFYPNISGPSG